MGIFIYINIFKLLFFLFFNILFIMDSNHNSTNISKKLFSNPVHGIYGKEKQIEIVIRNNIIIYDYFNNIWNIFRNYFNN